MSGLAFFREYLKNWKTVGAVAPSSPALAHRMVESGEVWKARHVLELGPGTGSLTAAVADSMPHGSKYLGIELNGEFVSRLRRTFPTLRFEQAGAQDFDFNAYMAADDSFDVIISGLPWAAFPVPLQTAILDHVLPRLSPGGRFVTFAYYGFHKLPAGVKFRHTLHQRLHGTETSRVVWGNLPPAFVYVARA